MLSHQLKSTRMCLQTSGAIRLMWSLMDLKWALVKATGGDYQDNGVGHWSAECNSFCYLLLHHLWSVFEGAEPQPPWSVYQSTHLALSCLTFMFFFVFVSPSRIPIIVSPTQVFPDRNQPASRLLDDRPTICSHHFLYFQATLSPVILNLHCCCWGCSISGVDSNWFNFKAILVLPHWCKWGKQKIWKIYSIAHYNANYSLQYYYKVESTPL